MNEYAQKLRMQIARAKMYSKGLKSKPGDPNLSITAVTKRHIERMLLEHNANKTLVACLLGIDRRTLYRTIRNTGIMVPSKEQRETHMKERDKLNSVRDMCNAILKEYREIPSDKIVPAGREIMTYARAAINLCDAIELGHRDSAKDVAFRDLDSHLESMMNLKRRMEGNTTKMDNDAKEPPLTLPTNKETLSKEEALKTVVVALEAFPGPADEKIGVLLGVAMVYCNRTGKNLVDIVNNMQDAVAQVSAVMNNEEPKKP